MSHKTIRYQSKEITAQLVHYPSNIFNILYY
jgi:hypothetical protein